MSKKSPLAEKLDEVKARVAAACAKAKREPAEVTLVAVTKTAPPDQIREILSLGVTDLGESRVQQLTQRAAQINEFYARRRQLNEGPVPERIRWHMIGHLQRNKAKQLLPHVSVIHSIDSLRLAEELDGHAAKVDRTLPVMLQVNTAEEPQKYGVAVGAALHLGEQIATMPSLQLAGLMCMAPFDDADEKAVRHCFARAREIFEEMRWHKIGGPGFRHLSMGMSSDFELGVLEGSTMVRVGTALFGGSSGGDHVQEDEG